MRERRGFKIVAVAALIGAAQAFST